ncbi:MAG: LytTR family transcriptional regulator DNA-binding domain-containing protein [Raineya sp.]|nr:LytTR family transcriptional regulator DNA-binding domain-containing protein [Raineya sp.]MDW8296943.1 LytTR family transcriptional regulator DNA-binding domain-containing protein [Raineya sp.]
MKKVLIVEDEFSIALDLETYLLQWQYDVVGIANDYEEAVHILETHKPHLALVDITLKGNKTGIDFAHYAYKFAKIPVIFLSALTDEKTLDEAMQARPFAYLTKPFKEADLRNTLKIASQQYDIIKLIFQEQRYILENLDVQKLAWEDSFFVKDKGKLYSVKVKEILWAEALENYTVIVLPDKKLIANMLLKDFEAKLPKEHFLRVHRSYLVSIDKIKRMEEGYLFITDVPIHVSKNHKDELLAKIKVL